jgi:hypothetical protein
MLEVGSRGLAALALALGSASGCSSPSGDPAAGAPTSATAAGSAGPIAPAPKRALPPGFLKGQLHVHTGKSGDSDTPPQAVHAWYEARGYDFIVFTDHNTVTDTPDTAMLTIPGVEITQNLRTCDPPPRPGDACLLHVNVLFAGETAPARQLLPLSSTSRIDVYRHGLELSAALGGVAMLNHPNMHFAADAPLIAQLADAKLPLMEVETNRGIVRTKVTRRTPPPRRFGTTSSRVDTASGERSPTTPTITMMLPPRRLAANGCSRAT